MLKRAFVLVAVAVPVVLVAACGQKTGAGLVPDAGIVAIATAAVDAAPAAADLSQCAGCTLVAQQTWTFMGIFRDDKCTQPLAQLDTTACMPVAAPGPQSVTYADAVGAHAANAVANVTLTDQIDPNQPRFRKTTAGCTRANEVATDVTPMGCVGQRVCRDAQGNLGCTNCRTFTNGCPDFEETRMYVAIQDTAVAGPAVNSNVERLKQCCNALAAAAKGLGASPEAMTLASYAAQCTVIASQAGPNGTAPELGPLRGYLQSANVPAVCKGL